MNSQTQIFKVGTFDFKLHHLLIIGILALSVSLSFMIRSQGADYGFELNEFDPFQNFRATEFLVENGFSAYYDWHDYKSWYPEGRNISGTSQNMLHFTGAVTYQIFGGDLSVYDFTILFPAIFGALTVVGIFALVRVIGGTTAGLFASVLFSVSLPILLRGTIGWYKAEPLGLFYGVIGLYLFLSGIKTENKKIAISKLIIGGIILAFGLSAWGGIQFFVIPIGMFILLLPFVRKDHEFIIWCIPIFVISFLMSVSMFQRPGLSFIFGLGGFSLIVPTLFMVSCIFVQKFSKNKDKTRNGLIFLFIMLIIGPVLLVINAEAEFVNIPQFRYLIAINPFLSSVNPLQDSVAEHATPTTSQSFFFHSIWMIFAGIGVWFILSKKSDTISYLRNDMILFSLIIGLTGIYVSSTFVRLQVIASITLIILASIGISILVKEIFRKENSFENLRIKQILKISSLTIIIILLMIPLVYPNSNWINSAKAPPTILNGGSNWNVATNDWKESLEWIKTNTPEDSVVASWWDYGYWITTMSDRATVNDNFTTNSTRIKYMAESFLSSPDEAWQNLQKMQADYVLVFVVGQRIDQGQDDPVYLISGGGDESKKQWFMRIAEEPIGKYVHADGVSGTDYFWNNTLLGKLFPFSVLSYVDPRNTDNQSDTYRMGLTPVYGKNIKYPADGDGPFRFVHASPSFVNEDRILLGIIIYEVNDEYIPTSITQN
jgi:dolichyl-diphosphooligosaccharide--protein glycosyltransferase